MELREAVRGAAERIAGRVRETPVESSAALSAATGCRVHLKLENFQRTGSFKLRGAMNRILALDAAARRRGVVAASSGNHGVAVATAAAELSSGAVVFVPRTVAPSKVERIRLLGAEVRTHGADCVLAEMAARSFAAEHDMTYVSPYNDPEVVAGQGTIGLELERQLPRIDAVFAALGGGGLIAGIGGYLAGSRGDLRLVACSPERSPVMHESLRAGKILDLPSGPTLSDATAGGVEAGAITFGLCRRLVTESILVSEDQIRDALRLVIDRHHVLIEGAAAVAVAGFLSVAERFRGAEVVIVLCGANIDARTLREVL